MGITAVTVVAPFTRMKVVMPRKCERCVWGWLGGGVGSMAGETFFSGNLAPQLQSDNCFSDLR